MRKSFVALALLVGAATMLTTLAFAELNYQDQGVYEKDPAAMKRLQVTKAARLGTSADTDTLWIGHTTQAVHSEPWNVGAGPARPGVGGSYDGQWDFGTYNSSPDSAQGWVPYVSPNTRTVGTVSDDLRPAMALDWGNRFNAAPVQGRTIGVISAWHQDNGVYPLNPGQSSSNSWAPLAGSKSAWCGLRAGDDFSVIDDATYGGTGNHINGNTLVGRFGNTLTVGLMTNTNFPGYANQWDQMLYRDVRVASNTPLTVSFLYETQMDNRANQAEATCTGWFDRDPLSMQQGGAGNGKNNFISASAYLGATPRLGPVDSFMVYVGVPTNPLLTQYTTGVPRPIFDLKRRWFSEVISINKPYVEILSTFGRDSAYRSSDFAATVPAATINSMITAQGGTTGGVIRIVFRSKTNANYADEQNTGGSFNSTNMGAVRIDKVAIVGATPAFVTSGFENAGEINNNIEVANSASPGPAVGQGYALGSWKATGKPPKIMAHLHPLSGGLIGPGNTYSPLAYADVCGPWNSSGRGCNINGVIYSMTDHDLLEAAGGADGTPFKENIQGIMSPTINLVTPATGVNSNGIDRVHVETTDYWLVNWDSYGGALNLRDLRGNVTYLTVVSYPTVQKNGATVWGMNGIITGVWSYTNNNCTVDYDYPQGYMNTSNESGTPDSIKILIAREQRCVSFGAPPLCSNTDGYYVDNVTLAFPPSIIGGATDAIAIDIWDWFNDAFPVNETTSWPGTAAFDTCAANIFSCFSRATPSTTDIRSNIAGDSMYIKGTNSTGGPMRMDCVFRILPGPGNYMTAGNMASGLRKVPSVAVAAASGDNSFWGQYMAAPGAYSNGTHSTGWNQNTWNSVRVDTVEINLFPAMANNVNLPAIVADNWQSTMHDAEPKLGVLGILKNRCFLIDPAAGKVVDHTNITCAAVPTWVTNDPVGVGYDGNQQTREYTKIFPDGLLTPGASVQYFYRYSQIDDPTAVTMLPDTNRIYPQYTGHVNYDGMRWASISVLPDKWKDTAFNGLGAPCMLVVDGQDRRGGERIWVGIADSIGATSAAKYGAATGWHCTGAYVASDGSNSYFNEVNCGTDAGIAVYKNGGQPGTTWDMYNIAGIESSTSYSGSIGGRLAPLASGLQLGKDAKMGPTPEMLKAYYNTIFFLSGNMTSGWFGKVAGRGADDILMTQNFLLADGPRAVWFMGDGFASAMHGGTTQQQDFLSANLATDLRSPQYFALTASAVTYPDLVTSAVISPTGNKYSVQNSCQIQTDVLTPLSVPGGVAASTYPDLGVITNMVAGVYAPDNGTGNHPYTTLVDGFDIASLTSRGGGSSLGRMGYFMEVSANVFGSFCGFKGTPTIDVPTNTAVNNIDFLGNVRNNPMVAGGSSMVYFGLAKADRVEVKVYDVTGRLVKTLANRTYQPGPQSVVWDGSNDQGQMVSRGVYFTQVKFANSGFVGAKKVTVLK